MKLNTLKIRIYIFLILCLVVTLLPVIGKIFILDEKLLVLNYFANGSWLAYYGSVLTLFATLGFGVIAYLLNEKIKNIYEQANNINKYSNLVQEKSMKVYLKINEQESTSEISDDGSIIIHVYLENLTQY